MPKGIDWKSPDAFTRLLAAVVAAQDLKLDYRKIASMYGQGATYDSIEGRFRIIKREAAVLRAEIDQGERPEAPPRGGGANKSAPAASTAASSFNSFSELTGDKVAIPRKPRTPKKAVIKHEDGGRVLTGRVGKIGNSGKKPSMVVKEEHFGEDSIFGVGHEVQKDLEHDMFMEALEKSDFDDVLHYAGGMGI